MYDPFTAALRLHLAGLNAWLAWWRLGVRQCAHLGEQQARFLAQHPLHRRGRAVPRGADWLDQYGRRHHDIDVEHMR